MIQPADLPAPEPFFIEVFGSVYAVHAPDARQRDVLSREWSRCAVPDLDAIESEPLSIAPGHSDQQAGYALASQITMTGIRQLRGGHLMLHACGLADHEGRVVALVASSGAGKTTAALTLARSGLGYVTDETVATDPTGAVLPYPKPLSVVDDERGGGPKVQHGPDDLGLGTVPDTLRLARLALMERRPGREGAAILTPLPLVDGLLELIPQTSSLSRLDRPLQTVCRLLDDAGGIHRLTYTEIADATDLILAFLSTPVPTSVEPTWEPFTDDVPMGDDMGWALLDNRVRLRPHTDAVLVGDEALIMVTDVPVRLGGIGLTIWQLCRDAPTFNEIAEAVADIHGAHPDAERIIRKTLTELKQSGVVAWGRPRPVAEILPTRDR